MAHSGPLAKQQRCISSGVSVCVCVWWGWGVGGLRKREALPAYLDILIIHRETRVRSVRLNSEGSSELWLWCQLQRREGYPGAVPSAPHLLFKQGSDQWAHSGSNGWGRCLSAMWMLLRDPIALVCLHRWSASLKACLASIITVSNGSCFVLMSPTAEILPLKEPS